ncbi:MAG: serine/threonine-protein kinase [Phycisphaerales bacterium]|nr:serine/threonine-protein kinase [Phycisphaerales bacterium]
MPPRKPDGPSTFGERLSTLPPSIGRYRLVDTIGWGGMGVVYRAEQDRPQRTVAIKVLRHECADPKRVQRLEQEAELLGRLHHPSIAQVYDAGSWDAGLGAQPYLVMEYIDGVPLMEYVRSARLSRADRIDLMIGICDAVQHAHDRGVIHRDLKPSNILVDADGHPRIVDFGVAALLDPAEGVRQTMTESGAIIGTTAYMSPEQAAGDASLGGPAVDVYALGVVTYEALAGRLPIELGGLSVAEAIHAITETQPRPIGGIDPSLAGDIEVVLGKALEKDPGRRYRRPKDLADDLRRILSHEPIHARPPTLAYRTARFVRRHRAAVAFTAAIVCILIAATVVSTWQAYAALRAEADSNRRLGQLRSLATSLIVDMDDRLGDVEGATAVHAFTVKSGLACLEEIAARRRDDPMLRTEVAHAYGRIAELQGDPRRSNLGQVDDAIASCDRGINLLDVGLESQRTELASLLALRGTLHVARGDLIAAERDLDLAQMAVLEGDATGRLRILALQAEVQTAAGSLEQAVQTWQAASQAAAASAGEATPDLARMRVELASHLIRTGMISEGLRQAERAAAEWTQLGTDERWRQQARGYGRRLDGMRGRALQTLGRSAEALPLFERRVHSARGRVWNDPSDVRAHVDLGDALMNQAEAMSAIDGRLDAAVPVLEEAIAHLEPHADATDLVHLHSALARARGRLAEVHRMNGEYEQALPLLERTEEALRVAIQDTADPSLEYDLADIQLVRAELMRHQRADRPAALTMAEAATRVLDDAWRASPLNAHLGRRSVAGWLAVLRLRAAVGAPDAAAAGEAAVGIAAALVDRDPANLMSRRSAAMAHRFLGTAYAFDNQVERGLEELDRATDMFIAILEVDPMSDQLQRSLSATHYRRGLVLRGAERWAEARDAFQAAVDIDLVRLAEDPGSHSAVADVVSVLDKVVACSVELGGAAEAVPTAERSVELAKASLARSPLATERQRLVAQTTMRLLNSCRLAGDMERANTLYLELDAVMPGWIAAAPDNLPLRQLRAAMCIQLGHLLIADPTPGDQARVAEALDEAEGLLRHLLEVGAGGPREEAGLKAIQDMRVQAAEAFSGL